MNKNIWISYLVQRLAWHEGCHAADLKSLNKVKVTWTSSSSTWHLTKSEVSTGILGDILRLNKLQKIYFLKKNPLFLIWLQFCKPEGNCFRSITSWRQFYILQNGNLSKLIQRNTVLSFKNLIYYKEEIFLTQGKSFCASSYILDVFQAVWLIKSLKRVLLGFSSSINGE